MDSMDVKGIAWVGNIYQKFEAMCLEVEEAMCQETAKYVENQVQTVGASMKRFCSDVMQDLLPPSSKDLSKVASAELLLNPYLEFGIHMKPISTFKEDVTLKDPIPVHVKGISEDKDGISEDKKSYSSNDAWEDWSFNWEISDKDEAKCEASNEEDIEWETRGGQEGQICNLIVGASPALTTPFAKSSTKGGKRSRCISSSNIIRAEHTNTAATCESSGLMVSQAHSNTSSGGHVLKIDSCENSVLCPTVSANTQCGQSVGDEVLQSHAGSSASAHHDHPDLEQENNTTTIDGDGDASESGFEETCVLVDGNDYHPIPINHKEQTRCSYKKKIQGAFSLKKKSARKQQYKQLQYDNNLTFSDNKKPDSIESEWELL